MDYPVLKMGDQGSPVAVLQRYLNKAGGYELSEDGVFGEKTYDAVKAFQESSGLSVDGIAGPTTWAVLAKKVEASGAPATADTVNWGRIGIFAAVILGGYMIAKRLGWQFGGDYGDEGDDR